MKKNEMKKKSPSGLLWYYTIGVIAVWSLFIGLSLIWHHKSTHSGALNTAKIEARQTFLTHIIFRRWNTGHGGLYAPITKKTQPNPYLDIPERDIQTPSGVKLTKINPAFMTRQANEMAFEEFGYIGHITSLNPIRPENKPDAWETFALKRFEQGRDEISSLEMINTEMHMRLMRPLLTEKGCLKCHAKQGYKEGDIRGGISVAIPMKLHFAVQKANFKNFTMISCSLWLAGIIGTLFSTLILNRQIKKRLKTEDELRHRKKLEGVIEIARAVCHELNQPLQIILGNTEIILMEDMDNQAQANRVKQIKKQAEQMGEMTKKLIDIANYKTKDMPQGKVIDIKNSSR